MNTASTMSQLEQGFELCFRSLFGDGKTLIFPCSASGEVDMDRLSERARCNYLFARAVVGRQFARPAVQAATVH